MKRKVIKILLLCILVFLIGIYSFVDKKYPIYDSEVQTEEYVLSGKLEKNTEVTQSFKTEAKAIDGISVKLVVEAESVDGQLLYAIYDESGEEVVKSSVSVAELKNDNFNVLRLEKCHLNRNQQYTLKMWCEDNSGISFYMTPSYNENGPLAIDQVEASGTMVLRVLEHKFDIETFIIVLFFAVYIYVFVRMLYKFFLK